jgi:hypothetical protein
MSLSKLKPDSCFSAKTTPIYDVFIKKPERARLYEFETHLWLKGFEALSPKKFFSQRKDPYRGNFVFAGKTPIGVFPA